ncbi:MAG: type II secretion system protein GspC [Luminiphilus sp.]|nr:type II secretion system protein GspC [Luminiphilus sp.]
MKNLNHSAWKARYQHIAALTETQALAIWQGYARDPERLRRMQNGLLALLVLWSLVSMAQLVWMPFRTHTIDAASQMALNPPSLAMHSEAAVIDISSILGSGLFGGASDALPADLESSVVSIDREGIEKNAKETRLALTLTGIVASAEAGLGSAVIKSGSAEQTYSVSDKLPASGQVVLAKVMPQQVVIDNNGTYELIKLYDGPGVSIPARPSKQIASPSAPPQPNTRPKRRDGQQNAAAQKALAGEYVDQLYNDPASLATAVNVSPVREGDRLVGYRIAPGTDPAAFDTWGFEAGDIVTAVNGLALSDASNTIKLYQLMKEADEATFDIKRGGGTVTISVDLTKP